MPGIVVPVVIVLLAYQAYVTLRVTRNVTCTFAQKWFQVCLIWLLPIVGAAIVHSVLAMDRETRSVPDKDFIPQSPNDDGGNVR